MTEIGICEMNDSYYAQEEPDYSDEGFSEGESSDTSDIAEVKEELRLKKEGGPQQQQQQLSTQEQRRRQPQSTIKEDKIISKPENFVDFYNRLKWKGGSVGLWTKMENGRMVKKTQWIKKLDANGRPYKDEREYWVVHSWQEFLYSNELNSRFFATGEINNMIVLDLDEMDHPICKNMKKMADKNCTMVVQTRKGFHYYFLYDNDFSSTLRGITKDKKHIFDLQSNGSMIYCPPSKYSNCETGEIHSYTLLKCSKLVSMSPELKEYIVENFVRKEIVKEPRTKTVPKKAPKKQTKVVKEEESEGEEGEEIEDEDEDVVMVKKMMRGLKPFRSEEVDDWLKGGYCLKNSGYSVDVFDYFSRMHFKDYDRNIVRGKFKELKTRTKEERKLSIATMWDWLVKDDFDLFVKLKIESNEKAYKIEFKDEEIFNIDTFKEWLEKDNKELGDDFFYLLEYSRTFKYFNHFHAKNYTQNAIFDISRETPKAYSDKAMTDFIIHFREKEFSFIDKWRKAKSVKHFSDFVFKPDRKYKIKSDEINLFTGFRFEIPQNDGSYSQDVADIFVNHVKRISDYDEPTYTYIIKWVAHIFQRPHIKTRTMIVLYSDIQGIGKNVFTDILEKILGKYYLQLERMADFTDGFNAKMQNRLLSVLDEVNARAREVDNELKAATTKTKIGITYKRQETYYIDDYNNYIFTTNNEMVLKVPRGDRRLMIVGCREEKLPKDEIKQLVSLQNNEDQLRQLFNFFMKMDLTDFDPTQLVTTEYKKTLMLNDLPPYFKMIQRKPDDFAGKTFTASELCRMSRVWAKEHNVGQSYTDEGCWKNIAHYFECYQFEDKKKVKKYQFPMGLEDELGEVLMEGLEKPYTYHKGEKGIKQPTTLQKRRVVKNSKSQITKITTSSGSPLGIELE